MPNFNLDLRLSLSLSPLNKEDKEERAWDQG